jgi:hypothetical protein
MKTKRIWKFELETTDRQTVAMPENAEILTVQTQNETPCIWAIVEPENKKVRRVFEIFGTGNQVNCNEDTERNYIGTYQLRQGSLVFHLFEDTAI